MLIKIPELPMFSITINEQQHEPHNLSYNICEHPSTCPSLLPFNELSDEFYLRNIFVLLSLFNIPTARF